MNVAISAPCSHANDAFESTYYALRQQARRYLRQERNAPSMSPTVLVHEAWIALAKARRVEISDGIHYVRLISRVMRRLLIDHARRKRALVNGGGMRRAEPAEPAAALCPDSETMLAVVRALEVLAIESPHLAELVELRYFAGLTETETGQILGLCGRTVRRQWGVARLRLLEAMTTGWKPVNHAEK
jgi:RNA polymerase sigma factor (TIGR02999 family)